MQGESVHIRQAKFLQRNRLNAQTKLSAVTWTRETTKSETHVGSCSVSNEECSGTSRCLVTRRLMEETMRSTLLLRNRRCKARSTRGLRRFLAPWIVHQCDQFRATDTTEVVSLLWHALLVQRQEATSQEDVKNFHFCLNLLNVYIWSELRSIVSLNEIMFPVFESRYFAVAR